MPHDQEARAIARVLVADVGVNRTISMCRSTIATTSDADQRALWTLVEAFVQQHAGGATVLSAR